MLILNILTLSSFTNKIVEVGVINDNTSIENDLVSLGLTPSDYINFYEEYFKAQEEGKDEDYLNNYNETYLIAVGENRLDDESTDVYLYLYNPIFHMFSFEAYYINLNINNIFIKLAYYSDYGVKEYEDSDEILEFCNVTDDYTIYKFKFNYINHVNERKYELDSIKMYYNWAVDYDSVLLNKEYENPFTATFKERDEDGKLVTDYEYNSFIYITEDEIVQLHFDDLTVFKESSVILDFLVGIFGSSGIKPSHLTFPGTPIAIPTTSFERPISSIILATSSKKASSEPVKVFFISTFSISYFSFISAHLKFVPPISSAIAFFILYISYFWNIYNSHEVCISTSSRCTSSYDYSGL